MHIQIVEHEYIAYIVQFSMMNKKLRSEILSSIDIHAFQNEGEIGETYLALNPDYFAVKAYRHFMATPDKRGLLKKILHTGISNVYEHAIDR